MNVELISIGQELLSGQATNTNAVWIAQELGKIGISTTRIITIPDSEDVIRETISESFERTSYVIVTGGLGPTRDDVTKKALCRFFETELVLNQSVLSDVTGLFERRGLNITELNRQQALVPRTAKVLRNPIGTAPGLWLEKDSKICVALPGVPYEMKELLFGKVIPLLREKIGDYFIYHRTLLTHGIGESFLADMINEWESNLSPHISLAYLPSPGIVKLRLTAAGADKVLLESDLKRLQNELEKLLPDLVWGFDNDTLEELVGKKLTHASKTISTAESCTGGFIAHKITSIPGSSRYFKGGIIAYSNQLKTDILGVEDALIDNHGAVSQAVVERMAINGRKVAKSDFCIATSGIAGPDGGTPSKPVGTTWIAVAWANGVESKLLNLGDNRERNIVRATIAALFLTKKIIDFDIG